MGTEIFLGMPPANIRQWIIDHPPTPAEDPDPEDTSEWGQVVTALENCSSSDFNSETLAYTGSNALLQNLSVGSGVGDVKYAIDGDSTIKNTTWINLGYNGSIPEYVKYRRAVGSGWKHIWIPSMKSGALADIAIDDQVYVRTYNEESLVNEYTESEEEVVLEKSGSFTYGNNNGYSVPTTIKTSKGEYAFCGYNITLNSQACIGHWDGSCMRVNGRFDASNSNRYSTSDIRTWLNTTASCCNWKDYDWSDDGIAVPGLLGRFGSEDGFNRNITKTVNRTWVYGGSQDIVADTFWLLDNGNINCNGKSGSTEYLKDFSNATSKFSTVFGSEVSLYTSADSRVKNDMDSDGGNTGSADCWWLRSAYSCDSNSVGYVNYDGSVSYSNIADDYCFGVAPACLIG